MESADQEPDQETENNPKQNRQPGKVAAAIDELRAF
jgi:hypothetical protein